MTKKEFASALGWKETNTSARLGALGLLVTCSRCHGSGHYSFNSIDGSKCYGCMGSGRMLPKFTAKLLTTVQARVAAGDLDAYLASCRAKVAAKAAIAPLAARAQEIYMTIGNAYTAFSNSTRDSSAVCASPEFAAQGMNNSLFYGDHNRSCVEHMSVSEIVSAVQYGRVDYIAAQREMVQRVEMLETLRAAWEAQ